LRQPVARRGLMPQVLHLPEAGAAQEDYLSFFLRRFRTGSSFHPSVA